MHNGCSIAGAAAADHPLVQAITAGDVPAHSIVLATSLDRYTRACGTLERLLEAAEAKGVRLVVLLPDSNLVAALLQHEEGYAAAALGSEACEALRDTAGGGATLRELEEHAAANYRLVQSAASSAPVAVPVLLNGCAPGALAASRAAEGQAAAFAAGRQASFSDALDARAVDGQQAGIAAFKASRCWQQQRPAGRQRPAGGGAGAGRPGGSRRRRPARPGLCGGQQQLQPQLGVHHLQLRPRRLRPGLPLQLPAVQARPGGAVRLPRGLRCWWGVQLPPRLLLPVPALPQGRRRPGGVPALPGAGVQQAELPPLCPVLPRELLRGLLRAGGRGP